MPPDEPAWTTELLGSPHAASDKAGRVRRMFNAIAPRYELVNTLFSAGRDASWRRKAVELAAVTAHDDVLDIASGTGDFARAFAGAGPRSVTGCDFAHEMLIRAGRTVAYGCSRGLKPAAWGTASDWARHRPGRTRIAWCEADALRLPFRDGCFSITSCAFGVRNFQDLGRGLYEMYRVLRPGGRAVILEFTRPTNRMARSLYEFYANHLMPAAASWVSRDRTGAYRYLPRSVVSFLEAEQMSAALRGAGFARTTATPLTMGVVTVYVATRD